MYETIGRCYITTYPVATNQVIASFLHYLEIKLEYLYYAIKRKADEFTSVSSQTTQANISASILKQTRIAIPHLPSRRRSPRSSLGLTKLSSKLFVNHKAESCDEGTQGEFDE